MAETYTDTRLRPIAWLAEQAEITLSLEALHDQEERAHNLQTQYKILPTIGCEVEIKHSSLFPDLFAGYFGEPDDFGRFVSSYQNLPAHRQLDFDKAFGEADATRRPLYEATQAAGIPAGKDAYWEFANAPTYSWKTLSTEVQLLMLRGLVPKGFEHSLHVTLGGVASEGGGMCLVLSGLELMSTTPQRIMLAVSGNRLGTNTAWARRGVDGLRARYADVLELGQAEATEMRSLSLSRPEDPPKIFAAAQMLGAILLSYRSRHEQSEPVVQDIAELWPLYRAQIKELWNIRDLPACSWGTPYKNPAIWQAWAESLGRREVIGTPEHHTIQAIEKTVAHASLLIESL